MGPGTAAGGGVPPHNPSAVSPIPSTPPQPPHTQTHSPILVHVHRQRSGWGRSGVTLHSSPRLLNKAKGVLNLGGVLNVGGY